MFKDRRLQVGLSSA